MKTAALRRRWLQTRRFQRTVRELENLAPEHLRALGIRREDIPRLAAKAAQL